MSRLPRSGEVVAILSRGVVVASGVLVGVLAARQLGAAGRGQLALIQASVMLSAPLFCLTLSNSNLYFAAREPTRLGALIGNSLAVLALNLVVLSLGVALGYSPGPLSLPSATWLWCHMLLTLTLSLGLGRGLIQRVSLVEVTVNLGVLLGLGWAAWNSRLTLEFLIYTRAWAGLLGGGFLLLWLSRSAGFQLRPEVALMKRSWDYGTRATAAAFLGLALGSVSQLSVAWFNGHRAAGLFAVAAQGGAVLQFVPISFLSVFIPRFVALDCNGQRGLELRRVLPFWSGLLLVLSLLAGASAPWWMIPVFGTEYVASIPLFQWLLPGYWCLGVQQMASVIISSSEIRVAYLLLALAAVVFNLIFNALLAGYGPLGGAWSFSLTQVLFLAVSLAYFKALV